MTQDQQNYERAVAGSLLGLAVQAALALALLGLGLWSGHPAVLAAAWHAGGGLLVWLCLALVFQQHRLERDEALEAEQLTRQTGAESRLFEQAAGDLLLARRRLVHLHRYALPLTGLVTGAYLLAAGAWLFWKPGLFRAETAVPMGSGVREPLVGLALAAGLTFLGFVVSRYLAGMARLSAWQLLRGGAGYLMGTVLVTGLLAAGFALAHFEAPGWLRFLAAGVPVFMFAVGLEIFLNLLLDLYRPRKPGEIPRPAFDSRLLGLLTSPESLALTIQEAINYQFGFEITQSWFWQLLSRAALPLAGLGAGALLLLSCFVIVPLQQQALVERFGALATYAPLRAGLHLKWPWPLERVRLFDVTRIRELRVGGEEALAAAEDEHAPGGQAAILWTNRHSSHAEELWIVAGAPAGPAGGTEQGPAVAVLNAEFPIQFRLKEDGVLDYAQCSSDPDRLLRLLVEAEVSRFMFQHDVDRLLGPERATAGATLKARLQQAVDEHHLGLEIVFAGLESVHPPQEGEVAAKFLEPIRAQQEKATALESAWQYRTQVLTEAAGNVTLAEGMLAELQALRAPGLPAVEQTAHEETLAQLLAAAGGQTAQTLAAATAFRWRHENSERAKADRFTQELLPYTQAPTVYRMRRYLEVLAKALAPARKYLLIGDRERLTVRLDLKDVDVELPKVDLLPK